MSASVTGGSESSFFESQQRLMDVSLELNNRMRSQSYRMNSEWQSSLEICTSSNRQTSLKLYL